MTDGDAVLRRIDHVGVVVDDLAEARAFLGKLGLQFDHGFDLGRVEAAFYRLGDVMIEVVECRTPEERARRLGGSTARIEHIAFEVDDLAEAVAALGRMGVEMTKPEPVRQDDIRSFWTAPESSDGVTYQLFERLEKEDDREVGSR
jgi:methylmalonyl-CoA/ethylmalonyl-CoA epimerase